MISKQVKRDNTKFSIKEYVMENMFCAPKGSLGWLGGHLMSQDRWLPSWVLDLLEVEPADSVLEVGSGPGLGLQLAVSRAYSGRVVGLDPSETMLEMAYRRNQDQIKAGRIELHLGTVDKLPFDDASFDKAMTMNSLHLWRDPLASLREINRTLRTGGRFAVAITRYSYASAEKFESHLMNSGFSDIRVYEGDPGICAIGYAR